MYALATVEYKEVGDCRKRQRGAASSSSRTSSTPAVHEVGFPEEVLRGHAGLPHAPVLVV